MAEELFSGFGDQKILAERANKDINGESLELSIDTTVAGETEIKRVTAVGGKNIYAEKADADSNGDSIVSTYAKKTDIVKRAGYIADGGTLTDNTELVISNNTSYYLNTAQTSLAFIVDIEQDSVANFEVTIKSTAPADCTVNVMVGKNGIYSSIMNSAAGSTTIETGKTYQLTCSRDGWTLAEFEEPADTGLITRIGGRTYKVVRIGNLYWMAENLDYAWNGINFPASSISTTEPDANYYNGSLSGSYGLLYSGIARDYMISHASELGFGAWRIPSSNDFIDLMDAVGLETSGTKLRATSVWADGGGTDDYGFNAYPTGAMHGEGALMGQPAYTYDEETTRTGFWASDNSGDSYVRLGLQSGDTVAALGSQNKFSGHSVRLCMDA
jgi:uncharacterized protein (TIGR02145 family)